MLRWVRALAETVKGTYVSNRREAKPLWLEAQGWVHEVRR